MEIITADAEGVAKRCTSYGGIFIGSISAEVLGDYGAGPNHVLPTSGTARYTGGLSVFTFLRIRTWMNITDKVCPSPLKPFYQHPILPMRYFFTTYSDLSNGHFFRTMSEPLSLLPFPSSPFIFSFLYPFIPPTFHSFPLGGRTRSGARLCQTRSY